MNGIRRYETEPTLKPTESPNDFWRKNRNIYPVMYQLALKYLSVQATSTSAERAMYLLGNLLTKKRMRLSDDNVKKLCYLSDCY